MPTPRNNKTKRTDTARPANTQKRREQNNTGPTSENEPPKTQSPTQDEVARRLDEQAVMHFLFRYQELEQAVMRAGYIRAGRTPGSSQPDWSRFARHIQSSFDRDSDPAVQGAVAYMLLEDDNLAQRNERLENSPLWEDPDPNNDTVWLAELLQQTWRKVIHALNFPGRPGCDMNMICAAEFILDAWAHLDPEVEKQLKGVH
jgi:hypothetical protein